VNRPKVGDTVAVYCGRYYGRRGRVSSVDNGMAWVLFGNGDEVRVPICDVEVVP
jgi:hypothetical protein